MTSIFGTSSASGFASLPGLVSSTGSGLAAFEILGPTVQLRPIPQPWFVTWVAPKIANLHSLVDNWDSYGASRIEPAAIQSASELAKILSFLPSLGPPTVGATPDGEVELSWNVGGRHLDVIVHPGGRATYVLIDSVNPDHDTSGRLMDAATVYSALGLHDRTLTQMPER